MHFLLSGKEPGVYLWERPPLDSGCEQLVSRKEKYLSVVLGEALKAQMLKLRTELLTILKRIQSQLCVLAVFPGRLGTFSKLESWAAPVCLFALDRWGVFSYPDICSPRAGDWGPDDWSMHLTHPGGFKKCRFPGLLCAIAIYCCVTNYPPNLMALNNNDEFLPHIVFEGQELGSVLAGWFWLGGSREVASRCGSELG